MEEIRMISSLILAAMMAATNIVNDKAWTNGWKTLPYDVPAETRELSIGSEAVIKFNIGLEVIGTNCVIQSQLKPIISKTNDTYYIRFEQPKTTRKE